LDAKQIDSQTTQTPKDFYSTSVDKSNDTHNGDLFEDKCFQAQVDHFNGVVINNVLPESPQLFDEMLAHSLSSWKKMGEEGYG